MHKISFFLSICSGNFNTLDHMVKSCVACCELWNLFSWIELVQASRLKENTLIQKWHITMWCLKYSASNIFNSKQNDHLDVQRRIKQIFFMIFLNKKQTTLYNVSILCIYSNIIGWSVYIYNKSIEQKQCITVT